MNFACRIASRLLKNVTVESDDAYRFTQERENSIAPSRKGGDHIVVPALTGRGYKLLALA
jgi:hypothetical protein